MNFEPLGERVLVELVKVSKKTESGILLPDSVALDTPNEGTVVAVGDEVTKLSPGDNIMFEKHTGSPVAIEGQDLCVVSLQYIIGVYRNG